MKYDNIATAYLSLYESTNHPMIDVDGQLKHRNNSEGYPIQPMKELRIFIVGLQAPN